ncbi:MAG: hypothetical protein GF390_03580 [Candidatus Pacebacteria bacterium]|nr:hypothetical protein [Candidatus Paceibacterota bacterium]
MRLKFNSAHFTLLAILLIIGWAVFGYQALFHSGLYSAHDIWHQVARFYHYSQALNQGQLLPTWISNLANNHGYPLFLFSYHLPWLIGTPLLWLGLSLPTALKSLFLFSVIGSGLTMYGLAQSWLQDRRAALLSALVYIWAPYHFLTVFVSAAIGTAFAFMFVPLIFWGLLLLDQKKLRSGLIFTSLGVAGMALSHLMTLVMISPLLGLVVFALIWQRLNKPILKQRGLALRYLAMFLLAGILGLGLAGFYLLPMLKYLPLIKANSQSGFTDIYASNFVNFKQLIYSPWGYGPIISNAKHGEISFQVGMVQWLGVGLSLGLLSFYWLKLKSYLPQTLKKLAQQIIQDQQTLATPLLLMIGFATTVFFMLDYSQPVWKLINQFITLDYPFRLLLMAVFFASLLLGWFLSCLKNHKLQLVLISGLMLITWYTNRNHVRVNMYTKIPVAVYVDAETTTNTFHEYLPAQADSSLLNKADYWLDPASAEVLNHQQTTAQLDLTVQVDTATTVSLQQFAFPGQTLYLDGQLQDYQVDGQGRIKVNLPVGEHALMVKFEQTKIILIGKLVSLLAILLLVGINFYEQKK